MTRLVIIVTATALLTIGHTPAAEPLLLENEALAIGLDDRGRLVSLENKLTGETFTVSGDDIAIEGVGFDAAGTDAVVKAVERTDSALTVRAQSGPVEITTVWSLGAGRNFAEKTVSLSFDRDCGLKRVELGRLMFAGEGLDIVAYRHPDLDWVADYVMARHGWDPRRPADSEPSTTFFGQTARGGFFAGVEMPYDTSRLVDRAMVLGFAPHARVKAGERFSCPPVYLGVSRKSPDDAAAADWGPVPAAVVAGRAKSSFEGAAAGLSGAKHEGGPAAVAETARVRPLPSESRAMVEMTSRILGPPRHGVVALACGWHCQMAQDAYATDQELEQDLRALEFLAACGLDGLSDSHPWGGASKAMAALREGDHYELDPRVSRFLARARELGLKVVQWPTMNNTHPWRAHGGPFRLEHREWLRGVEGETLGGANADNFRRREANCLACGPFADWLSRIILDDALGSGLYQAWCMDGDFWGTGAYVHTTVPVTCLADNHDHLPGDANDACQRRLERLVAEVRRRHPGMYIMMCRPPMDLGVWAQRNVDACFTLIESGTDLDNVAAGDEIRTASRIRVQQHFFPPWLDQGLLFPSYANPDPQSWPAWPSAHIDYAMLSALSCSPNLLLYLPARTGIPDADKAEIRKWLHWGRANQEYLMVRRDFWDWPLKGKVDGSAHILGDKGLVFLFNGTGTELPAAFPLDASIGLEGEGRFTVTQEYPVSDRIQTAHARQTIRWEVPPRTAVALRIQPADK